MTKKRNSGRNACLLALTLMTSVATVQVASALPADGSSSERYEIAQERRVSGKVTDIDGSELPGVSILVKGTTNGTTTDLSGNYSLANVPANGTMVFSFIGMVTQEVAVDGRQQINVTLEEDAIGLDEVVAIGYGVQRKSDVTGAVSTVKADELMKRPILRLEQALQGTTPGVQVVSNSGQPGKGLAVKIRGASSISGGTDPLYVIDGQIGGGIDALNPNDIQSIEILKDASASAIYGSRGTNGVVLVTTKSGELGKPKISFSGYLASASVPKRIELLTAAEFAETINKYYSASGNAFSAAQIEELRRTGGTDWAGELEQTPLIQNYDLNISGGNETFRYRISYNHMDQPGIIKNSWYAKDNLRANLDIKVNSRLDVKFNISYIQPKSQNAEYGGDIYDPFSAANIFDPTLPVYNENGEYNMASTWGSNGTNPVAEINESRETKSWKTTVGTGILTYKIMDGLTFTSNNTYSSGSEFSRSFRGEHTGDGAGSTTRAEIYSSSSYGLQSSNFLTYDKTFGGSHHLTATLLYERSQGENINQRGRARQLSTTALTYYNLRLGAAQETESGYSNDAMQSYMLRANYSYKDRYLLTLSMRRDGSSKLTEKYDNFPSAAIAWNIARESFLENHDIISGLKIRASYGETGNQAIGAYSTIPRISTGSPYYFDGKTSITTTPLGTPVSKNLKWEHAKQSDLGIDAVLYNGRLTFTADVYNKDVVDLLYDFNAPSYMGGGTYKRNIGTLNNRGLEMTLGGIPVNNRDFSWNSFLTVSFNRNKVVDLGGEDNVGYGGVGTFGAGASRLMVGHPLADFWGWEFLGTWKTSEADEAAKYGMKPGDPKYTDIDHNYAINEDDKMVIGNGTPDVSFGFINDFRYKDFSLSIMFQGMSGNEIYSQTFATLWGGHGMSRNATIKEALNVWSPENENDIPLIGRESTRHQSSRFVYDGSFIKLKNVSLSYNVPAALLHKLYVSNLEVYVSGQNLLTFTKFPGMDPETNSSTGATTQGLEMGVIPNPRMYTFGLRIGF
ncbi:MAG: TonB-dependent receptor [Tannerella sp.]|nr:TonB-dependent receptor [Tannerella sp.]